jgi:hypothetical protein
VELLLKLTSGTHIMSRLNPEPLDRLLFFFSPDPEGLIFHAVGFDRVLSPDRVGLIEHLVGGTAIPSGLTGTPDFNHAEREESVANRPGPWRIEKETAQKVDRADGAENDTSAEATAHRFAAKKSLSSSPHASASTPLCTSTR